MKRMKRFGTIILVIIALLVTLAVPAMAEEVDTVPDEPVGDITAPDGETEDAPTEDAVLEDVNATVISRVYEWVADNSGEVLSAISTLLIAVFAVYQKGNNGIMIQGTGRVLKSQNGVESASNKVTEAVNSLLEKQDQLNKYYEQYSKNEGERNKVTAALLVEVMSLIEIQHIAYINNSNVPQSMKNLMTSKYARCLSVINDDVEIKAAYEEMRVTLGIAEDSYHEKTDT